MRGLVEAGEFAHELQRGGLDFVIRCGRFEIEHRLDVAAHPFSPLSTGSLIQIPASPLILAYNARDVHPVLPARLATFSMAHVTYKIIEHDGGWTYTVNGVFSEAFATHAAALAAAKRAAAEQPVPGRTAEIPYQTAHRKWPTH